MYISKIHGLFVVIINSKWIYNYAYTKREDAQEMLETNWRDKISIEANCKPLEGSFAISPETHLIMPGEGYTSDCKTFTAKEVLR